jgi:tRNA pseudouridine65 synthase
MKSFVQIKEEPYILWEDDRYLACWKPNNLLVHRTNFDFGEKESLRNYLIDTLGKAHAPLHRLDKPTSGVVLFAKDKEAFKYVQEQFVGNSIEKEYVAIVRGFVTPH